MKLGVNPSMLLLLKNETRTLVIVSVNCFCKSLEQEDPLEKEMATHSSILAWENHRQRSLAIVHGVAT